MSHSFLLVIPEGWYEVHDPESIMSEPSWSNSQLYEVTEALKVSGEVVEGDAVVEFRVFRDAGTLRVWVLVQPE